MIGEGGSVGGEQVRSTPTLLVDDILGGLPQFLLERLAQKGAGEVASARLALREALRLLYLLSSGASGPGPAISNTLDEAWHVLILETRIYQTICSRLPGGEFIHHTALAPLKTAGDLRARSTGLHAGEHKEAGSTGTTEVVLELLVAYVGAFGPFEAVILPFWAGVPDLMRVFDLGLPTLNARLAEIHAAGLGA